MAQSLLDSIKSANQFERRSKLYQLQNSGRLRKGQSLIAAASSIPSKYQTIVSDNSEQKGFGSCSRRFNHDQNLTEGPAPSHYNPLSEMSKEAASFSKKGTGSFASKTKRFHISRSNVLKVAPGQYNPLQNRPTDYNRASCTSNFHLPIAVNKDAQNKFSTPAPNKYDAPKKDNEKCSKKDDGKRRFMPKCSLLDLYNNVEETDTITSNLTGRVTRENNIAASAAFKSRSRRDLLTFRPGKDNPGPGAYNVDDAITKAKSRHASAPFKSTTDRGSNKGINANPGPGSYRPFEPVPLPDRKRLPRQHYLGISAPAMPLPPSPPAPGPGHYNLVNYYGEPRRYVSSSVFVSTTNRLIDEEPRESEFEPGPASYHPQNIGKQSFIYNTDNKWI